MLGAPLGCPANITWMLSLKAMSQRDLMDEALKVSIYNDGHPVNSPEMGRNK